MTKPTQWTIRRLLLWVFVAALIASHLANFYQQRKVDFNNFTIEESDIVASLAELDPTAEKVMSGGGSVQMMSSVEAEYNFTVVTKTASSFEVVEHVRKLFAKHIKESGWSISGLGEGTEGFSFQLTKGSSRFMVYCWVVPPKHDSFFEAKKKEGATVTNLKVLQIGYSER